MFCLHYKKRDNYMFKIVDCGAIQKLQVNEKRKIVSIIHDIIVCACLAICQTALGFNYDYI